MSTWDGSGVDPWLPERLAAEVAITKAERRMYQEWWGSFSAWLVTVHRSVLRSGERPDASAVWAHAPLWAEKMTTFVQGPVMSTMALAYEALFGRDFQFDARPAVSEYLATVHNRMVRTTDEVYDLVASEVARGAARGDGIPAIADRVDEILSTTKTERWPNRAVTVARTECLTGDTLVESDGIRAAYRRWYEGPVFRVRMASGYEFTGTPNHPVLTPAGWVALGRLNPGDQLVRHRGGQGLRAAGDVHIGDVPARLSEVHDALSAVGVVVRAQTGEPDFHGDGRDGYVDVATTDRQLADDIQATQRERFSQVHLEPAGAAYSALHASGDLVAVGRLARPAHNAQRPKPATDRVVADSVLPGEVFAARAVGVLRGDFLDVQIVAPPRPASAWLLEHRPPGLAVAADGHAVVAQDQVDRVVVGAVGSGQSAFTLAGPVGSDDGRLVKVRSMNLAPQDGGSGAQRFPRFGQYGANPLGVDAKFLLQVREGRARSVGVDDVVLVERLPYAGHVFNLFTERGWFGIGPFYSANTIGALNAGRHDSFAAMTEELGEELEQQWLSTLDGRTRETHSEADGQRVPVGATFSVGGAQLRFPGDPFGPAEEIVNCRCTTLLVAPDEEVDMTGRGFSDADEWWASELEDQE